jgi:spore coat protein JC
MGVPFSSNALAVTGDPVADIVEDMAAEQKARATYERLMNMTTNEQLPEPLCFLWEREAVHFQRFGECLNIVQDAQGKCHCGCQNGKIRQRGDRLSLL